MEKIFRALVFFSLFLFMQNFSQAQFPFFGEVPSNGFTSPYPLSYSQNPAQISKIDNYVLALQYSPSIFEMPELSPAEIFTGYKFSDEITAAAAFYSLGNSLYNEMSGKILFAYQITNSFIIGASGNFSNIHIKNYSNDNKFQVDLGTVIKLNEYLSSGFSFRNLTGATYKGGEKTKGISALIGFGIEASDYLQMECNLQISPNHSSGLSFAAAYNLINLLKLRAAYLANPSAIEAEAAFITTKNLQINISMNYQDILGFSKKFGVALYW